MHKNALFLLENCKNLPALEDSLSEPLVSSGWGFAPRPTMASGGWGIRP